MATVKELQQIATERGISWRKTWNKQQLMEALGDGAVVSVDVPEMVPSKHQVPGSGLTLMVPADPNYNGPIMTEEDHDTQRGRVSGGDIDNSPAHLDDIGPSGVATGSALPGDGEGTEAEDTIGGAGAGSEGIPDTDEDWEDDDELDPDDDEPITTAPTEEEAEGPEAQEAGAGEGVEGEKPEPGPYDLMTKEQLHAALQKRGMTHAAKSWTKEHLIRQMEALDRGEAPIKKEQEKAAESVADLLAQLKALGPKDGKAKKQIRTKLRRQGHFISKVGKA